MNPAAGGMPPGMGGPMGPGYSFPLLINVVPRRRRKMLFLNLSKTTKTISSINSWMQATSSSTSLAHSPRNWCGLAHAVCYFSIYCLVAFMYLMPMSFEIFTEQQRILTKIQMQMVNDSMMGGAPDMAPPNIRPFW